MKIHTTNQSLYVSGVVTSTNRLAYETQGAIEQEELNKGNRSWKTIEVLPYSAWIKSIWALEHSENILLNNSLLLALAENAFGSTSKSNQFHSAHLTLWDSNSTAKSLIEAWTLCLEYKIELNQLIQNRIGDHALFVTWLEALVKLLSLKNGIGLAQLAFDIEDNLPPISGLDVGFLGFDQLHPQQHSLIRSLKKRGNTIEVIGPTHPFKDKIKKRHSFLDLSGEWCAIAAWALYQVNENPDMRVAIICPDTQSIKDIALQSLDDQLSLSESISINSATPMNSVRQKPYHFSLGTPVSKTGLGSSAFIHLTLLSQFQFQDLTDWLLSPYWGSGVDIEVRALLALQLKQRVAFELDLFTLVHSLKSASSAELEVKAKLEPLLELKKLTTGKHSYRTWAAFFRETLTLLNWPKAGLNSHEHQVLESWNECLDQFAALDVVGSPIYLSEALSSIRRLCDQTIYQDQANPNVQIHIMGVLEAAELSFDGVWLAGFHERAWPPRPQANPFIPLRIQREKGIPDAVPEIFLQHAKDKMTQLLAMAADVVVSHASTVDDIIVGASPMVSHIELTEPTVKPLDVYGVIRASQCQCETLNDDFGFPFEPNAAKGGAGLIASQAACPFQAYAKYRLLAEQELDPEPGTDHRIHGTMVHEILQQFWALAKNQSRLIELINTQQLESVLDSLIKPTIAKRNRTSGLKEEFDNTQTERVKTLLITWLELEANRSPFIVSDTEKLIEYSLAGLGLRFIVDRIDTLEGTGGHAVIDYKTGGSNSEKDWCSDRPDSPQLPLYALAVAEQFGDVNALAYGQINAKETATIGLSKESDLLPDLKPPELHSKHSRVYKDLQDWEGLLPIWKQRLEKIATEFRNGKAIVAPKDVNKTCMHCDFTAFCRIKELSAERMDEDDFT